jgi:transketolase
MALQLRRRRAVHVKIDDDASAVSVLDPQERTHWESFDMFYRSLCAVLYNYVPMSGHPGGSISSGRIVTGVLFDAMDYDVGDPEREDADMISYAAGHKALGLYVLWAMRNEMARIGDPNLLSPEIRSRLRLEDLLGFRRNPVTDTPLFSKFDVKALDGHPTPATPFVRLSTGASGVGVASSIGLALAAKDTFGDDAPRVHIIEGEGGLTPGRVAESLAAAATACLDNVVLHIDWNQSSIDSDRVCPEADQPGDYVQWTPAELAWFHDWNVVEVADGMKIDQVLAAQRAAREMESGQPTAVVYRTVKGWRYGIEGRGSHGAGHKLCSTGFYEALSDVLGRYEDSLPSCCDVDDKRCGREDGERVLEECFWEALTVLRNAMEKEHDLVDVFARRLSEAKRRLDARRRKPRAGAPRLEAAYALAERKALECPAELDPAPGSSTTLRGELGRVLRHYNEVSGGAFLVASADLLGSTSVDVVGKGFGEGFYNASTNPASRLLSLGGICEDAISGILAGVSSFGNHVGVASSYGAFMAPLGHIAARLHAIGNQARGGVDGGRHRPMILVCAHAGLKTGEDGPTHADPQALQLVQENFPAGTAVTLTPWDPAELWPLVSTALAQRPAVILPFVTRPSETVPDRKRLGLAPATDAVKGVYRLRAAEGGGDGTVVLQGSGVTLTFVAEVLPRLIADGIDLDVYYVASAELFDTLPRAEREAIFSESQALDAMGITGFTLPTIYRWVLSDRGRALTVHPFGRGHFLGSGKAERVLEEAGLDAEGQYLSVTRYVREVATAS